MTARRFKWNDPLEARFQVLEDGCWQWVGSIDSGGYGVYGRNPANGSKKSRKAHRIAYEKYVGPIPEGLTLDHLCRNRACVNPAHLEPVTMRENMLRGESIQTKNAAKTHCNKGHEFTLENTRTTAQGRRCRACAYEQNQKYRKDAWACELRDAEREINGR